MATETTIEPEATEQLGLISTWDFNNEPPTPAQVVDLLKTLPPVWGVEYVNFADYVQALPQGKKVEIPNPKNPRTKILERMQTWSIYMPVAGRIKMLETASRINGWTVNIRPEPVVPEGCPPGYLRFLGTLLFRVYVEITTDPEQTDRYSFANKDGEVYPCNGVRFGTANITISDKGIGATNPWEKVETSALGRALGAWGFGVLPGVGIASIEEMQIATANLASAQSHPEARRGPSTASPEYKAELVSKARKFSEDTRMARSMDVDEWNAGTIKYLQAVGVDDVPLNEDGSVDFGRILPGALETFNAYMLETLAKYSGF